MVKRLIQYISHTYDKWIGKVRLRSLRSMGVAEKKKESVVQ